MRITLAFVAALSLAQALASAADTPQNSPGPSDSRRLSQAVVIRIALADLKRRKLDVGGYAAPTATFSPSAKGGTWSVYFQTKETILDGCFWILIDDRTGKVNPIYQVCG